MHNENDGELKLDISEQELIERYVEPYLNGETIVINGTTIDPKRLYRVKIAQSENPLDDIVKKIEQKDRRDFDQFSYLNPSAEWRAIDEAIDITDKYINKAPGSNKKKL